MKQAKTWGLGEHQSEEKHFRKLGEKGQFSFKEQGAETHPPSWLGTQ